MQESPIEIIKKQTAKLSLHEHIKLMEALAKQLRKKSNSSFKELDWADLYGLGRGLWNDEDAQDYVDRTREDRR
jgi:hypothetical protein